MSYTNWEKIVSKMANLETLAHMSPNDAIIQAQRLSQSIKDNEVASKIKTPNEPLSQIRPSNTGTDNGAMALKTIGLNREFNDIALMLSEQLMD